MNKQYLLGMDMLEWSIVCSIFPHLHPKIVEKRKKITLTKAFDIFGL